MSMNIFIDNGNSTPGVSQDIHQAAILAAHLDTQSEMQTPVQAPSTVQGYWDGDLSSVAVCSEIVSHEADADAFVIACFSDPGLYAAREISSRPVVGIAESAMITALQLGSRLAF